MRILTHKKFRSLLAVFLVICMLPLSTLLEVVETQAAGEADPNYTVQYYAEVEKLKTSESKGEKEYNKLAFVDTAENGKLPTNTEIKEKYLTLDSSGKPIKETVVAPLFKEKNFNFFAAPNLGYVDIVSPATNDQNSLLGNGSYDLKEVWVLIGSDKNSTDKDDWKIYDDPKNVIFTNDGSASGTGVVNIKEGTVIRLVYERREQSTTYSNNVQMFDYDITDGKVYTSNGKRYVKAYENGINSDGNYKSGSTVRYAFGNRNMGVKHQDDKYNGVYINRAATSGMVGDENTDTCIKQCHFGLVGNSLEGGLPKFKMAAPDIFSKNPVPGKNIVAGDWTLGFIQDGDTFTLSTVNNGSKNVLTNLETLRKPGTHDHIRTNFFWPLDGSYTTTDGKTYSPGNGNDAQLGDSSLYKEVDGNVGGLVPGSDEGENILHNCYFGMNFTVDFEIEEGYIGPLEYLFFGDDDMWVYLDGKLIIDIGGVHSSVGEYVDLWDYLDKDKAAGKHKLDFFYVERGASGSSCYMHFTLPSVVKHQQSSYGNLAVSKAVTGTTTDEKFDFTLKLDGIAVANGITNIYPYTIQYAKGGVKEGFIRNGEEKVQLGNGDQILIPYLPVGATYKVTESVNSSYIPTVNGKEGNVANGTIQKPQNNLGNEADFANIYNRGDLVVEKVLAGTHTNKADEFTFTVTLSDATVNGTYGDMTFTNGVAEFTLKGGESKKATGLLAGTTYTIEESDSKDYYVSSNGATGTIVKQAEQKAVFTNSRSYTSVKVTKVWEGYAGRIPEGITIQLSKVEKANEKTIKTPYGDPVVLNADKNWTHTWTELDATYGWEVDEVVVPDGYDKDVDTTVEDGAIEVVITNTLKAGGLSVTKKLEGKDADSTDEFPFEVTLDDTSINGTFGDMIFVNGKAEFTLKGGQTVTADDLPIGVGYTVVETDSKDYHVSYTGEKGTIVKGELAKVEVTNRREYETVTITKVWEGYEGRIPASIEVQLFRNGEAFGNPVKLSKENKWTYTWDKLDADSEWSADETEVPAGYVKAFESETDDNGNTFITVTNTLVTGGVKVSKVLAGDDPNPADEFPFRVTLDDETINGTFGDMTFENGVADFTLKGGESAEATGLPAGINYVVEELDAKNYHMTASGEEGTIVKDTIGEAVFTNSRSYTSVTITKVWEGYNGRIPASIEVQLYRNEEPFGDKVVLSEDNDWTYTWKELDATYTWTADEAEVPAGYEKELEVEETEDGIHVTVTNKLIVGSLMVTKVLAGEDVDSTDAFPFKVTLSDTTINGTFGEMTFVNGVAEFTLKGGESVTATGLPAGVTYVVEELDSKDYHVTSVGATGAIVKDTLAQAAFTNSRSYVALTITKVWEGYEGKMPESIKVQLYKDGKAYGDPVVLSKANDWTYTWTKLDATCSWTADETEVPAGYDKTVLITQGENNSILVIVTNKLVTGGLKVNKVLGGTDADPKESFPFKVTLDDKTINGTFGEMTFVNGVAEFTLKGGESVTAIGLPAGIGYTVGEIDSKDYYVSVTGDKGVILADKVAEATFLNSRSFVELTITKVWEGFDGKQPAAIKVQLYRNGKAFGTPVELSKANNWTYTWTELDASYTWTADEVEVPDGYVKAVHTVVGADGKIHIIVTNKLLDGGLKVTKLLAGTDADPREAFPFRITLSDKTINGTFGDITFVNGVAEFTLRGGQTVVATGLPADIGYVVEELDSKGYYVAATGEKGVIPVNGIASATFVNSRSFVELTITKVWEGNESEMPDSIKVQLYRDGKVYGDPVVLSKANRWTYTWTELDAAHRWTADEVEVPEGYDKSVVVTQGPNNSILIIVTNTLKDGNLEVEKVLAGADANPDDRFPFRVTLDDKTINGTFGDMTFVNGVAEFTLRGGEKAVAEGLPAGVAYVVEELDSKDYYVAATGDKGVIVENETAKAVFVNSRSYVALTITKVWEGYEGRIPASVKVQLYRDGAPYGEPIELSAANNWTYTWTELDAAHTWTADEAEVPAGFEKTVEITQGTNNTILVVVTNKLVTGGLKVTKTIEGKDADPEDVFPFKVTLDDASINGTFGGMTFVNGVAEFALKGGEVVEASGLPAGVGYTVEELDSKDYKMSSEGATGTIVKDTVAEAEFVNFREFTNVGVMKVWRKAEGETPEFVKVQLYRDGEAYGDPVELSEANGWKYAWTKLDAAYEWTVDEVEVPAGYHKVVEVKEVEDGTIYVITNVYNFVKTGDNTNLLLSIAGMTCGLAGAGFILRKKRETN